MVNKFAKEKIGGIFMSDDQRYNKNNPERVGKFIEEMLD